MKKLDLTKPVQTRDGRKARILAADVRNSYPVVALITNRDGSQYVSLNTQEGYYFTRHPDSDLVNVPEKKVWERWVVVYPGGISVHLTSYNEAQDCLEDDCTIIHVKHEYIEGENQQ